MDKQQSVNSYKKSESTGSTRQLTKSQNNKYDNT